MGRAQGQACGLVCCLWAGRGRRLEGPCGVPLLVQGTSGAIGGWRSPGQKGLREVLMLLSSDPQRHPPLPPELGVWLCFSQTLDLSHVLVALSSSPSSSSLCIQTSSHFLRTICPRPVTPPLRLSAPFPRCGQSTKWWRGAVVSLCVSSSVSGFWVVVLLCFL